MTDFETYQRWLKDARTRQIAHIKSNSFFALLHQVFGALLIILSSIAASSFFAVTIVEGTTLYYVATILSIIITIVAALQTSLKFSKKAEKHHDASVQYGDLRRDIEKIGTDFYSELLDTQALSKEMVKINDRQVLIDKKRPSIPQFIYKKIEKRVRANPYKLFNEEEQN